MKADLSDKQTKRFIISLFRNYRQNKAVLLEKQEDITSSFVSAKYGGCGAKGGGNGAESKVIKYIDDTDYLTKCCEVVENTMIYCKHDKTKKEVLGGMLIDRLPNVTLSLMACVSISELYYLRNDILRYALAEAEEKNIL